MKTIVIIWLILAIIASIFVVAALMLSSRISQDEGVIEYYDDWEAVDVAQEIFPQQIEQ